MANYTEVDAPGNTIGAGDQLTLNFIGTYYTLVFDPGVYTITLWGGCGGLDGYAQLPEIGEGASGYGEYRSQGGNVYGTFSPATKTTLYGYVGSKGRVYYGGWNGGGNGGKDTYGNEPYFWGGGGGGATDLRVTPGAWNDDTSLNSRVMIAAGAGGQAVWMGTMGRSCSIVGEAGSDNYAASGQGTYGAISGRGGTQTAGGAGGVPYTNYMVYGLAGSFGQGANGVNYTGASYHASGAGGGGYYGGGSGSVAGSGHAAAAGGAGSSFISGYAGCQAITSVGDRTPKADANHYSGIVFTNGGMGLGGNLGNGLIIIQCTSGKVTFTPGLNMKTLDAAISYVADTVVGYPYSSLNNLSSSLDFLYTQRTVTGVNTAICTAHTDLRGAQKSLGNYLNQVRQMKTCTCNVMHRYITSCSCNTLSGVCSSQTVTCNCNTQSLYE
jgi:hypothetical protein